MKKNSREIDRTGASRTVDRKLAIPAPEPQASAILQADDHERESTNKGKKKTHQKWRAAGGTACPQ